MLLKPISLKVIMILRYSFVSLAWVVILPFLLYNFYGYLLLGIKQATYNILHQTMLVLCLIAIILFYIGSYQLITFELGNEIEFEENLQNLDIHDPWVDIPEAEIREIRRNLPENNFIGVNQNNNIIIDGDFELYEILGYRGSFIFFFATFAVVFILGSLEILLLIKLPCIFGMKSIELIVGIYKEINHTVASSLLILDMVFGFILEPFAEILALWFKKYVDDSSQIQVLKLFKTATVVELDLVTNGKSYPFFTSTIFYFLMGNMVIILLLNTILVY